MKIAVLSDIHGNSLALAEVLKDIKRRGISKIFDLGDSLYGPLDPQGTFKLIQENNVVSLKGNQDRLLEQNQNNYGLNKTLDYVLDELDSNAFNWIKTLPFSRILENIKMFHASPEKDDEYLMENIKKGFVEIKGNDELEKATKNISEKIILCGHSHTPGKVKLKNGKIIINPGSVGLPAYDDDEPNYHKMESGNPRTKYLLIEVIREDYNFDFIQLDYDFKSASKLAEVNGRSDWAKWILTGKV